nr:hypothetical protein CFP56_08041 [Quercus suber]
MQTAGADSTLITDDVFVTQLHASGSRLLHLFLPLMLRKTAFARMDGYFAIDYALALRNENSAWAERGSVRMSVRLGWLCDHLASGETVIRNGSLVITDHLLTERD